MGVVAVDGAAVGPGESVTPEIRRVADAHRARWADRLPSEIPPLQEARRLYHAVGIQPTRHRPCSVALLRRVEDVLDIEVPLGDLPAQAEEWEQAVTEMTAEDEEIAEYVAGLEARGDAEIDVNEAMSKVDGDSLAAEFERYLRRRGR